MAFLSIGDKVLNILVNIFLAILGWYWVFKDGDILSTTIEGLGEMENKCVRISNHSRADFLPDMFKGFLPKKED